MKEGKMQKAWLKAEEGGPENEKDGREDEEEPDGNGRRR